MVTSSWQKTIRAKTEDSTIVNNINIIKNGEQLSSNHQRQTTG